MARVRVPVGEQNLFFSPAGVQDSRVGQDSSLEKKRGTRAARRTAVVVGVGVTVVLCSSRIARRIAARAASRAADARKKKEKRKRKKGKERKGLANPQQCMSTE